MQELITIAAIYLLGIGFFTWLYLKSERVQIVVNSAPSRSLLLVGWPALLVLLVFEGFDALVDKLERFKNRREEKRRFEDAIARQQEQAKRDKEREKDKYEIIQSSKTLLDGWEHPKLWNEDVRLGKGESNAFNYVFRIRALRDIPRHHVKKGDIGGWIASESNLSREGDAWVADIALVCQKAKVTGDALVCGVAQVFGEATIKDEAVIKDKAAIYGKTTVAGNCVIGEEEEHSGNEVLGGEA